MYRRSRDNGLDASIYHYGAWLISSNTIVMIALLVLLPPLTAAAYILAFSVNVVNYDRWGFVPLFDKFYCGMLFPGLLILGQALLSLTLLAIVSGLFDGANFGQAIHLRETGWKNTLVGYWAKSDDQLTAIYPQVEKIKAGAAILEACRLNIFCGGSNRSTGGSPL